MTSEEHKLSPRSREGVLSAIGVGFFFVLAGTIFIMTPHLYDSFVTFLRSFDIVQVPNTQLSFFAPASPDVHTTVYAAVLQFSIVWSLFQIAFLMLRLVAHSPLAKKAETLSNVIFWIGASYLIYSMLNETTTIAIWFAFWSEILMLLGLSLVIRAMVLAVYRRKH
jgi:hypothetical protein